MSNKFKLIKNIRNILKNNKNVKWKDNIDLYNLAEQGLLYQLDNVNKNLEDIKSETMDLLEKGYSSYLKNNIQKNNKIKKCKKSYNNLNELCKEIKCNDFHGCENFIEEKMIFDKSIN